MSENDSSDEIGYGKPPKSGQFTKGKSGNPKGRPKGSKNLSSIVLKDSQKLVRVNGPHGTTAMSRLEAAVMQLINKAIQGSIHAQRALFDLVQRSEADLSRVASSTDLPESDQKVIGNLLRRFQDGVAEPQTNNQESEGEETK